MDKNNTRPTESFVEIVYHQKQGKETEWDCLEFFEEHFWNNAQVYFELHCGGCP